MLKKQLLILDLDETLIYATEEQLEREPDFRVGQYFVYKRPFVESFLKFCIQNFEVAVWTSSTTNYANQIVENTFDSKHQISFVWARNRCTVCFDEEREPVYEKKITKVRRRGYGLKSVIVVDDSPEKWRSSYGNLVRVKPFSAKRMMTN